MLRVSNTPSLKQRAAMSLQSQLLLLAGATVLAFGLWTLASLFYPQYKSPMRMIPGPKSSHWLYGNLNEILEAVCVLS